VMRRSNLCILLQPSTVYDVTNCQQGLLETIPSVWRHLHPLLKKSFPWTDSTRLASYLVLPTCEHVNVQLFKTFSFLLTSPSHSKPTTEPQLCVHLIQFTTSQPISSRLILILPLGLWICLKGSSLYSLLETKFRGILNQILLMWSAQEG
jgi:hypothetical protein